MLPGRLGVILAGPSEMPLLPFPQLVGSAAPAPGSWCCWGDIKVRALKAMCEYNTTEYI